MNLFKVKYYENDDEADLYGISIVDSPANQYQFITLSEEKQIIKLASDKEKQLLTGVVLIPNQRILRKNPETQEYYELLFEEDVIEKLSQDFFKKGYQRNSTYNHNDDNWLNGTTIVESWIIEDSNNDKANALGFKDLPKGTWMISMKLSDKLWAEYIKTGIAKGFSIDSYLRLEKVSLKQGGTGMDKLNLNEFPPFHDFCKCELVNGEIKSDDPCEYCQEQINKLELNKLKLKRMNKKENSVIASISRFLGAIKQKVEMASTEVEGFGTLSADAWEVDNIVYQTIDGELKPLMDTEFEYEGKIFKTDSEGVIVSIEDKPMEDKTEVEMESEQLGRFEGENGVVVYAEWLTLGKILTDENQSPLVDFTFEREGIIYMTDSTGEIVSQTKNANSPYWKVEMTEVADEAVNEIEVVTDELTDELEKKLEEVDVEALKTKIAELEAQLEVIIKEKETVLEENMRLSSQPASTKLKAIVGSKSNKPESTVEAIARIVKLNK
jgi:hypothetical protein